MISKIEILINWVRCKILILLGFPRKLISLEFRLEFRSKLIWLSTKLLVEIVESNLNFDFDFDGWSWNYDKQSKLIFWLIYMLWNFGIGIEILYGTEFQCRTRNSYSEIEIRIEIPISALKLKLKFQFDIKTEIEISILTSKSQAKFWKIETSKFRRNKDKISFEFWFRRK
jgi:hypothetical protein